MKTLRSIAMAACALTLAGCGLDVMYADWKIDRLCKVDGGVKVFATDSPPVEFRMPDGNVDLTALQRAKPGQSYYVVHRSTMIRPDDPTIRRLEIQLFRGGDDKLMGTSVIYIRPMQHIGVPFFHRNAHSCPATSDLHHLTTGVFFPNSLAR